MLVQGTGNGNVGRTEANANDVVDRVEVRGHYDFGEGVSV